MIDTVVGNYKILEKIGEGGMGAVYKGLDLMLEREVAIKVLKPELASQPQVVERFRTEAVTLAKLNHPNVATLFSFFRQGDYFFMVLEFVRGTTLDKIIEARGAMTCEQSIPLFCQMLEGIDHAHRLGIVHRDIKPANMMLTESGVLKVLDFGIARALGSARMTRAGHLIGTIEYMSPEQVRGLETDARSDIYSLGMVLYELLTGRVPFAGDSEYELMKAQVEKLPTPPREFSPHIPEEVEAAILCATEKDPDKRFQTAAAFSDAIDDCIKSAIATGQLSQMDIQRSSGRMGASSVIADLLAPTIASKSTTPPSDPAVLDADLVTSRETSKVFAPTRIADVGYPQVSEAGVKSTRFVPPESVPQMPHSGSHLAPSPSLFSRLTWKHYSIGGAIAIVILAFAIIVPVAIVLRSRARAKAQAASSTPAVQTGTSIQPEVPQPNQPSNATQTVDERELDTPPTDVNRIEPEQAPSTGVPRSRTAPAKRPVTTTKPPCTALDKAYRRC